MRRIRSAFKSTSTYKRLGDNGVYYIFLTTLPMQGEDSGAGFDGYMPYGKPFGFVHSTSSEAKSLAWAIAHELGHGAFQLQHIWQEQGYSQDTRNLMGYSSTTELFRWQWDHIHNPVDHSNLMADEEDLGATIKDVYLKWIPIKKSGIYTFLSPAGLPFSVKDPTEVLVDAGKVDAKEYDYETMLLKRCSVSVYSFEIDGVRYASKTGEVFSGFYKEDNNEPYEDKITNRKEKKINVWLFDRSKLSSDFPFRESVCNYSIDDILASHSGSLYNKEGYYAAGKIPCRWNDEICLKKGGWNFATYDEKDIEYLLNSSVLRVAICSNPMVLEGETIHFADIISNYQMPFDLPSVREFFEKLWNCENENYWLTFLPRKDQLSMAGVCGLIAGAAETAVGAADLIQIAFYSKERKEFIDGICQLFTMDGFRQFCTTIKGNFVDNIWDNPNECERAYYEGKLLFDVASSVYGVATVIKSIKSAGGMLAFLKQATESWTAIPKFTFDNLGKNSIVKLHELNYSFKKTIAEAYIYYSLNANIKIATITSEGLIVPKVAIYVNNSKHVLTLKDVNYKIGNVVKKGDLELCVSGDEHYFVEKIPGSNKWETLAGDALKEKLKALPDGEFYNDFAGASDDVVRMLNRNPALVDVWKKLKSLNADVTVRTDIKTLETLADDFSDFSDAKLKTILGRKDFIKDWQRTRKLDKDYLPDRDLFFEYYDIYKNPKYYNFDTGFWNYPSLKGFGNKRLKITRN